MATALVKVDAVNGGVLSKEQKAFNRLTTKIAKLRGQLVQWHEIMTTVRQTYASELMPMLDEFSQLRLNLLQLAVGCFNEYKLTKTEQKQLSNMIASLAEAMLAEGMGRTEEQNAMIKVVYNQFSGGNYDEEIEASKAELRQQLEEFEEMFDLDLGDVDDFDFSNPEEFMQQVTNKLHQKIVTGAKPMAEEDDQEAADQETSDPKAPQARKKTAKQLAKEERERAFEAQASQSLREVYRKLASSLHPDREPDPAERERKTELMQKLNQAYERKDLLALLELQLQIEQLDAASLAAMSAERLGYFNKVLKEQVNELEQELDEVRLTMCQGLGFDAYQRFGITPKVALTKLHHDINVCKREIVLVQKDIADLQTVDRLKVFLRGRRGR